MIWINFKRIVKSGFINFWRNGLVSLASVLAIAVSLYVIGGLMVSSAFLNGVVAEVKNKVDISVSFKPETAVDDITAVKKSLSLLPDVKKVVYVSREDEYKSFRERHQDNALLLQSLDEVGNPFGARLNITAIDPNRYESIVYFLENDNQSLSVNRDIIDQVSFKRDIVSRLNKIIGIVKRIGLVASTVLICLAVFATFNTISLAIYTSREEVSVMRLVGAGNIYVKGPFLIEGIISGFLGTLVALFFLYPSVAWIKNVSYNAFGGVDLLSYLSGNFASIFLTLLVSGVGLGFMASYLAVRRYASL
ncbi:MAG: cell division protein [Parcubacteria group bacterium GW2011_GWC1_43_11b]|uniref:Cell division protein FtsX n=1 Tax=Candidatus Vogelbacteria bacterium RIFOXYB1_FULL_42_16 TaxID=1802436 RepID=A0A1G2QD35_9BACT|nr:MAG: cell division protein [Parcubacteria group bacterium GW2011_GWB1_42_9]KKS89444.1 MAG: cell division protein [Parcubacteria group bacterium GW2011_GWC1_43_11b]KKT10031.1 MAG: cell division protein [Parcubacteria group bacterium GW2011_GWA1_43_21]OHA58348.1 MAG: hypothetical protein A2370_01360 [Candidatus Vogelbacteria bacterium RIFOXYB1_FULL_42_16]